MLLLLLLLLLLLPVVFVVVVVVLLLLLLLREMGTVVGRWRARRTRGTVLLPACWRCGVTV